MDEVIRLPELLRMLGLSRSRVYLFLGRSKYGDPTFPRPIQLSNSSRGAVGWLRSEVISWLEFRKAQRQKSLVSE